jgi:hypothetical protein
MHVVFDESWRAYVVESLATYRDGVRPIVVQLGRRTRRLGSEPYTDDERPYINAVRTLEHMGGLALVGLLHTHEGLAREVVEKFGLQSGPCLDLGPAHKAFANQGIDVDQLSEPVEFINAFKHGPGHSMNAAYDRQGLGILNETTRAFVDLMQGTPLTRGVALKRGNLDVSLARFDGYAATFIGFWQAFPEVPRKAARPERQG